MITDYKLRDYRFYKPTILMKHFFFILLFCVSAFAVSAQGKNKAGSDSRIAYYNLNLLLNLMPEFKLAADSLAAYQVKIEKVMSDMNSKLQQLTGDSAKNEKEIVDLRKKIANYKETSAKEIEACNERLLGPILEKVKLAQNKIARENGYTEVLDTSEATRSVVFPKGSVDIFDDMCKELGIPVPKKK